MCVSHREIKTATKLLRFFYFSFFVEIFFLA